jgi:Protein of unknown function (DUF2844)
MIAVHPTASWRRRVQAAAATACAALIGCGAVLVPASSRAALGAPFASIAADQAQLRASVQVTTRPAYEVHELTLPSGTAVREFVASSGLVFAIAWNGPSMPDLRQLLGSYFADYTSAAQLRHGGHHHLSVSRSDLSIQSSGHMRAFSGRAVLLQALPAGVSADELR